MPHRIKKEPDGWTIREAWDPKTGKRTTTYFYKRNRAPRIELNSRLAQQLGAYSLIEKDLRNVMVWLDEIEKLHPTTDRAKGVFAGEDRAVFNLIKGLYVAALTFYGKCYTQCEGRRVKLEKRGLDEEFHQVHDEVMHMRHNFAAHSGADNFEEVKIALVFHPKRRVQCLPRIYRELQQPDMAESSDSDLKFIDLVNHAHEKVWEKIRKVEKAIYEREVVPKGFDYWYSRGKG